MARTTADRTDGPSVIEKGLGVLERAWEAQWALRLICGVLFFDMLTMLHSHRGLLQWSAVDNAQWSNVGWLAISVASFSAMVALVLPVTLTALRQIVEIVLIWLPRFPSVKDNRPYQRPLEYVFASDLRRLAMNDKDDFLLRLYEIHEQTRKEGERSRELVGELTAAALVAAGMDVVVAHWTSASGGLIDAIIQGLADWSFPVIAVVLLMGGSILKWAWFSEASPQLIYYPPLDRELINKERKSKGLG